MRQLIDAMTFAFHDTHIKQSEKTETNAFMSDMLHELRISIPILLQASHLLGTLNNL